MGVLSSEAFDSASSAWTPRQLARLFDHTNLKPDCGLTQIQTLCQEAADHEFAAVCVAPRWVVVAADILSKQGAGTVAVCTVVGFPHGNTTTKAKVLETQVAARAGAREIDMVISIGDLKDGNDGYVEEDISEVVQAARSENAITKVILETAYLEKHEIVKACKLAVRAGAEFVKTSTGFAPSGANADVVRLMRDTVGDSVGVKAAGGIRTLADVQTMVGAGADRLGCSSSVQIVHEFGHER